MNILERVNIPDDIKKFSIEELKTLAYDVRRATIEAVAQTGGHLGAGLGVVELTVALHHVFNTPKDKLIWDVGHQTYPHKILTGRKDRIHTLRQEDGLSGFTKRSESEYDPFGAAHSSTSISAALGMAVARDLAGENNEVIAVIGDGAMSAGMAYEAMNNAGAIGSKLIVILNDNEMSIAPPVGAMSKYLSKLIISKPYQSMRTLAKTFLPKPIGNAVKAAESLAKEFSGAETIFEKLGFYYIGPIDGHDLSQLVPILENLRDSEEQRPYLLHVITQKGKGYAPAENSVDKYHGVVKFDVESGEQKKSTAGAPSYTKVFADALIEAAREDEKIVAITAAMPDGTGLDLFAKEFPKRTFDVGIAEQHAVTFAAGLACEGFKPFCAIYSTFLQRAYDQVVHDVAIQNLPVRFAIDRAGLVGADGSTHAGAFDVTYLATLPNFVVMAAADEVELVHMVATSVAHNSSPIALRYPRGAGVGLKLPKAKALEIGKGRIVREGKSGIAILSFGTRLGEALKAAEKLDATVADARFCKPLDEALIRKLATENKQLVTVEEGAIGGFGSHVADFLAREKLLQKVEFIPLHLPDTFQDQASAEKMYDEAGLNAEQIIAAVKGKAGKVVKLKLSVDLNPRLVYTSFMDEQNIINTLRLIRSENIGPRTFYSLLRKFGTAQNALNALPEIAQKGGKKAVKICSQKEAESEYYTSKKLGISVLIHSDAAYPELLKQTYDAPPLLFYKGNIELASRKQIGIVGTRNASANGCAMARRLVAELGQAGYVATSGLARGIDTHVHKAALTTGTIAVVANGLDSVYPPENEKLFEQVAEQGLILSENPIGTTPQSRHFPQRNRVIAGLSLGVLVVEAATRSGSLITADFAAREGREIFAVPGSPLDPRCSGTNFLLKNGAVLVENARDIIDNLGREIQPKLFEIEDSFEEELFDYDTEDDEILREEIFAKLSVSPVNIDELAQQTDAPIRLVNEVLLELEIAGKLERSWGNKVRLLA